MNDDTLVRAYLAGATTTELARAARICRRTVQRRIQRAGLPLLGHRAPPPARCDRCDRRMSPTATRCV